MDPFRLSVKMEMADGSVKRLAADEIDPEDQPAALGFGTVNPGGFGTFGHILARGLEPGIDENLLDSVTYEGAGGQTAYEGRVHRLPRSAGDDRSVNVQGVGWSSHLTDFRAFRERYVDASPEWKDPGFQRRRDIATGAYVLYSASSATDEGGNPALVQSLSTNQWTTVNQPVSESWYDGGNIPIGSLYYEWEKGSMVDAASTYTWAAYLSSDDHLASSNATTNLKAAGPGSGTLTATTDDRLWARLAFYFTGSYGTESQKDLFWTRTKVYGNHGLTLRGSEPDAGFYASDIITDVIQRCAPRLRIGSLADTGFVIPHAVYLDPVTAADVILDVNKYGLLDWFVWEDRTFSMVSPDPLTLTWNARAYGADANAKVTAEGDDVVQLASSAYVFYEEPYTGRQKVYGPTGAEYCDNTSDYLLGGADDPYSLHGIDAPITLKLSFPASDNAALQIGRIWLAENNAPKRSGEIVISGMVDHPTEGPVPCWRMRAGDYIRLVDRNGDVARKIVSTSYSHQTRTVTCTLQAGPLFHLDSLMQRIGVEVGVLG